LGSELIVRFSRNFRRHRGCAQSRLLGNNRTPNRRNFKGNPHRAWDSAQATDLQQNANDASDDDAQRL
jgi:hypothetical protein